MSSPAPAAPGGVPAPAAVRGEPVCLQLDPHPVLGYVHLPANRAPGATAVLLCPPFGWDELCSYRARRAWAAALAQAGLPALRIDLPGAGDSGGMPSSENLLSAWIGAVAGAAAWLRDRTGVARLAVIGLGLGGMVAWEAAAAGAPIDDLVLWGVPDRGRRLVRELRAYAGTVAGRYASELPPLELPDGGVEVTGFLLSGATVRGLEALTLSAHPLPGPQRRRVLLIGRDALGVDRHLHEHLAGTGVVLTVRETDDFAVLMAHPQDGRIPRRSIEAAVQWLGTPAPSPAGAPAPLPAPAASPSMLLGRPGARVRETPVRLATPGGASAAILTEPVDAPAADVCVVLLNAGAIRRIGPNRTWVEAARRWAGRGVPCVRVDIGGVGESEADPAAGFSDAEMYSSARIDEVVHTLDALQARGIADRFVLVGLCSGAYWAVHAAVSDARVVGVLMVNLYAFAWSPELVAARDRRQTAAALRQGVLRRLLRGGIRRHHLQRAGRGLGDVVRRRGAAGVAGAHAGIVETALRHLELRGIETLLLFSGGEPLLEELERDGWVQRIAATARIHLDRLPSTDHNVRALALQRRVHAAFDRALERALSARRQPAAGIRG
jgi:pimeloyl-ACP methyl ester carboxylesterase